MSKDFTNGKFKGHYTIRAMSDLSLIVWKQKLVEWADEYVIHVKEYKKDIKNV